MSEVPLQETLLNASTTELLQAVEDEVCPKSSTGKRNDWRTCLVLTLDVTV